MAARPVDSSPSNILPQFLLHVLVVDVLTSSLSHQSVSATDTLRAATLTGRRGGSLANAAEAFVTVCTTRRAVSVRTASRASTEILSDRTQPPTPANVRHTPTRGGYVVANTLLRRISQNSIRISCLGKAFAKQTGCVEQAVK